MRSDRIKSIKIPTPEYIATELEKQVDYANANMIGKTSSIKNSILDIHADIQNFDPSKVLSLLGLNGADQRLDN